jgi:ubiquinone biosynthesis protein
MPRHTLARLFGMKIASIPQIYRHLARWREIISVLSRHGLANWVSRLDLEFAKDVLRDRDGEALARLRPEERVRLALVELGPTFIKLGQILSTRPDLVGVALAGELQQLQDEVRADPPETARATIESELGQSIEELFAEFDPRPLASASIGQVHAARLKTGEPVVIKVQHAGIEDKVRVDLDILSGMAMLAERIPEFQNYRPRATAAEFQRQLRRELDFGREERNMQQFAADFADDPRICIPRPYSELCTGRVLTMQRLEGTKLADSARLAAQGIDLNEVARRGAELYLKMIFGSGLYHADPHPGNLVLLPSGVIGLLDFGMVGRIDEPLREDIEELFLALAAQDAGQLANIIIRLGSVPPDLDRPALASDLADFISHYAHQSFDKFDLSGALNELVEMIRRYRIMLPARIAMLIKVLVMLEGTSRLLAPQFNLMELMQPMQSKMLRQRLSPTRQLKKLRRFYFEVERLAGALPRGLTNILEQVQAGRYTVHLDHRGLEPSVNRLVYGMLTSALFLGSTQLLTSGVPPRLSLPWFEEFSVLGALGCGLSIALGLRLLRAISKSGHLDGP